MVQFCKQFVKLLRATPDTPLRSKSEQNMWRVVMSGELVPAYEWWGEFVFKALNHDVNNTTCVVYSFIRDNQTLFHKAD